MNGVFLNPIGFVVSDIKERVDENWGIVKARIEMNKEYTGGLTGLESFSHAIILTYLHESQFEISRHLKRRPRGLLSMPELGIFSQKKIDQIQLE